METNYIVTQLRQKLILPERVDYYFLLLRLLTIAGGLVWYLVIPHDAGQRNFQAWLLILYTLYSCLLYGCIFRWPRSIKRFYLATFLVDLVFVSVLVRYAGAFTGSFFIAFYLLVAIHSYYFGLWLALGMSAMASVFYSAIYFDLVGSSSLDLPDLVVRLTFLFLIALSLGLLTEREKHMRAEVKKLNQELAHKNSILEQSYQNFSIGKLVGEIAEGINDPCGTMSLRSEVLMGMADKETLPPEFVEGLEVINRSSHQLSRVVKALLALSRCTELQMKALDLNQLIEETLLLMDKSFQQKTIRLEKSLEPSLPSVLGDTYELGGVLVNLLSNAKDALPRGGTIGISTQTRSGNGGREVECTVSDNGEGIRAEHLQRIFSPFFTTKESRGGIGLGLSSSLRAMKNHDGLITVSSKPGEGSIFSMYLPFAKT